MPPAQQPAPRPVVLVDGLPREQLLAIVGDARVTTDPALDLEGHGSSGVAVLSLALHQRRLGLEVAHAACIHARGEDDPVSGLPLGTPTPSRTSTQLTFVAGRDEASAAWTAATAAAFREAGWEVTVA